MKCCMCGRAMASSALPSISIGPKCAKRRGLWAGEPLRRRKTQRTPRPDARQADWVQMLEEGSLLPVEVPPQDAEDVDPTLDEFELPIVRRIVPAAGQPLPETLGPRSIFDLCQAGDQAAAEVLDELEHLPGVQAQDRPMVTRDAGVTRAAGCAYPANRWTPEREEQERQRRAKQRPPKPQRQRFKMKGTRQWADAQS